MAETIFAYNTTTGRFVTNPERVAEALSYNAAHFHVVDIGDGIQVYIVDTPERTITVAESITAIKLCKLYHTNADEYYALVKEINKPHVCERCGEPMNDQGLCTFLERLLSNKEYNVDQC